MALRLAAAGFLVSTAAIAQVTITTPGPQGYAREGRMGDAQYGSPQPIELNSLDTNPESYQRAHVYAVGRLEILKPGVFWTLNDASTRVLLLLGNEMTPSDFDRLSGWRLEVRGIVRRIRKKEYTMDGRDMDLVEDPTLPVLPEPSVALPRISITVLGFTERRNEGEPSRPVLGAQVRNILDDPEAHADKKVRVVGQFRGSNLFGDLPASTRRGRSDWVLKEGDTAFWVLGKEPRGKGWALDPAYRGDTERFVAVEGKPEVVNGVVYLRASKVTLATRPVDTADDDDSP